MSSDFFLENSASDIDLFEKQILWVSRSALVTMMVQVQKKSDRVHANEILDTTHYYLTNVSYQEFLCHESNILLKEIGGGRHLKSLSK